SPAGRPVAEQVFACLLAGQETQGEEVEFRHADGRQIYCTVWVRPMRNAQGEIEASRSIIVDITQRKRMEAEREKLIDELDAFAHTVAHDLKNPLTGIMAYAELLQTDWAMAEERQRATDGIMLNGRKMSSIIKELLLLAEIRQIEAVDSRPLDMERVVQEAQQRLLYLIESEQVEVVLPAAWPAAQGYAPWVEEVWANYLSNGVKYGGRPPRLELGATVQGDNMVRFWVQDNGRGLAADEQIQLFTPFTRLNQVQITGHGLGLSIVQRIVDRLGGQVGVESEVGRGSTFWFTLPAA
ncbi:MAG TPA: PAS domain-containing sensor histidine kinase, partial [Anaerolineae bacterium]